MTKADFVRAIAKRHRLTLVDTRKILDTTFGLITLAVISNGRFYLPGFGTWSIRKRKARTIADPTTGEPIRLAASRTVGFRPSLELKARLP